MNLLGIAAKRRTRQNGRYPLLNFCYMTELRIQQASWLLAGLALFMILHLHLLSALLAGLLVYELVHLSAPLLESRLSNFRAKQAAVVFLATVVIGAVVIAAFLALHYIRADTNSLASLAQKMAELLENSRRSLPDWVIKMLPENLDDMKAAIAHWLREHAGQVQIWGKDVGVAAAHILFGLIVGALLALREVGAHGPMRPLAAALAERARRLAEAFRRIVFAQVRISAINALFTALYLVVLLPLWEVNLPLRKTMVALTFVVGLLPVLGNLISNTVIVIVSLAHSPQIALASLVFLVVIHKLEYFLNARIVGSQISARTWELLLAMLFMEAAFGLPGIIAAPIFYAYLKQELVDAGMV